MIIEPTIDGREHFVSEFSPFFKKSISKATVFFSARRLAKSGLRAEEFSATFGGFKKGSQHTEKNEKSTHTAPSQQRFGQSKRCTG